MSLASLQTAVNRKYLRVVEDRLLEGRSVFVEAPRHYGKEPALRTLASELREREGWILVDLSSRADLSAPVLDPAELLEPFFKQLGRLPPKKKRPPEEILWQEIARSPRKVLAVLSGGARGNESNHFALLAVFDKLLRQARISGMDKLAIIAIDDGSLFQKNDTFISPTDAFAFLKPAVRFHPLPGPEIAECLRTLPGECPAPAEEIEPLARWIAENSGGHPGLIAEMLKGWPRRGGGSPRPDEPHRSMSHALEHSAVLDSLSRALQEDPEGLARTALEYLEPRFPEGHNPRINLLSQLGILHWTSSLSRQLRLCPGAITQLVRSAAEHSRQPTRRVGTVINEAGPRIFLDKEVPRDDDDIIIVQLSDLHIGPDYRHAIWRGGEAANVEERTLGELLAEDLARMELTGRVDGLILSGDFVSNAAEYEQFQRAREVVEEIFEATGVAPGRAIMVPGNHDVNWKPGEHAKTISAQKTSLDFYQDFSRQLLKRGDPESVRLVSRSGRRCLDIIGLDSNHVEGPESGGIGYISPDSFRAAQASLHRLAASTPPGAGTAWRQRYLWVIVHHHLLPITDSTITASQKRKVSVMANAAMLFSKVTGWRAEMVLHGHAHQPSVTVTRRWPTDNERNFSSLPVIACGSVGAKSEHLGPFARNQYFVIYRRKNDIILRSRCMDEQGVCFTAHKDVLLPQPAPGAED